MDEASISAQATPVPTALGSMEYLTPDTASTRMLSHGWFSSLHCGYVRVPAPLTRSVKGDIPIYINVRDTFKTLQTIRDLDGICNYYPAWDHTYSVSDIDEKINDAEHIICTLDEQVQTILEIDKATDITIITSLICERLKMPYLKENPLFRKTILAHCLNHGDF